MNLDTIGSIASIISLLLSLSPVTFVEVREMLASNGMWRYGFAAVILLAIILNAAVLIGRAFPKTVTRIMSYVTPSDVAVFSFGYREPYVQPPETRIPKGLPGWRFSVGFIANRRLVATNPKIVYATMYVNGKWERLISSNQEDNIGWDAYQQSYNPKEIPARNEQQIVLFHYGLHGDKFELFNERDQGELSQYKNIGPGEYKFILRVTADNLDEPLMKTMHVWWYGTPNTIRIEPEDYRADE